jgi:HAMP domain-containing protein
MDWYLAIHEALQVLLVLGLAWIAAWQRRAANLVEQANGRLERLEQQHKRDDNAGAPPAASSRSE